MSCCSRGLAKTESASGIVYRQHPLLHKDCLRPPRHSSHLHSREWRRIVSHSENDMEILADLQICQDAFQKLNTIFPSKKIRSIQFITLQIHGHRFAAQLRCIEAVRHYAKEWICRWT